MLKTYFTRNRTRTLYQAEPAGPYLADLPLKKALEFPILSNISTSCMDLVWPRCGH